MMPLISKNYQQ